MALPKKKMSRTRRNSRRAHTALDKLHLVKCPSCGELTLPHHVCPSCGKYRGVEYVSVEADTK